ncbi:hypothetical protein FAGKG844_10342 [Frankia sp. AgKG'84/4]
MGADGPIGPRVGTAGADRQPPPEPASAWSHRLCGCKLGGTRQITGQPRLAEVLYLGLRVEGFDVDVVHGGLDGYWQAREGAHDVIALDVPRHGK